MSNIIHMEHVNKKFGELAVLDDLTLDVPAGQTLAVIGPSGSGKSTLLRLLMGLERPDSGRIEIEGEEMWHGKSNGRGIDVNRLRRVRAKVGMVFQQFNLFPHMTVLGNLVAAPIHVQGMERAAAERRAMEYLEMVELSDKALVYPGQLSGGQNSASPLHGRSRCGPRSCCSTRLRRPSIPSWSGACSLFCASCRRAGR